MTHATLDLLLAPDHAPLVALLVFALLFTLFNVKARRGRPFPLRPIAAYERIKSLTVQSIETGQPIHVGVGSGAWAQAAPELVAGLTALDYVGQRAADAASAAAREQMLLATTGNPVALLLAMNLLPSSHTQERALWRSQGDLVGFSGPDPLAYVGGAASEGRRSAYAGHLLLGQFGSEGLWLAEALQPASAPILGGASDPAAAALIQLSVERPIIGEDLYAVGAYLHRRQHLGSLAAQDWMRFLLAVALIAGALAASLGLKG